MTKASAPFPFRRSAGFQTCGIADFLTRRFTSLNRISRLGIRRSRRLGRLGYHWLIAWFQTVLLAIAANANETAPTLSLVRIGIGPGTFVGADHNDAKAAITTWAKTVARQRNIPMDVETQIFNSSDEMHHAITNGTVDAISSLADQFLALEPEFRPGDFFVFNKHKICTEEYVLLAGQSSGVTNCQGLLNRKLVLQDSSRTCLASCWLEVLFHHQGLGSPTAVLKTFTRLESASKPVLQVFFHQADACVVTRSAFELAGELNPQLRQKLRLLATSPPVIPVVFFFSRAYQSGIKGQLEQAILELHHAIEGRQVLTVFQGEEMVRRTLADLTTCEGLLTEARQLRNGQSPHAAPRPVVAGTLKGTP